MPQVKAAAIVEILRSGSPQRLGAIMATGTVQVAKAKHVRTLASLWSGNCCCFAWGPRIGAIQTQTGAIALRRLRKSSALSGGGI